MDTPYDEIEYDDLEDIRYISKGNFGQIYRASYHGTDVAVKQLLDIGNTRMHKYIEREMSLLMSLRHPHIVQFMGLCKHDNELFIITEFVPGGDLYDRLRDASANITWKKRVRVALETAQAICYLHSKGVIHRDLKSQNLLVDEAFRIKICDFGFARSLDPKEYMTMCGTDEWMAPEVILGEKYDASADVFSFGMILAELILRRDPPARLPGNAYAFDPDTLRQSLPPDCPEQLFEICVQCTQFFPEERPEMKSLISQLKELEKTLEEHEGADMSLTYMKFDGSAVEGEEKKKKKKKRREGTEEDRERRRRKRKKRKEKEGEEGEGEKKKKRKKKRDDKGEEKGEEKEEDKGEGKADEKEGGVEEKESSDGEEAE